MAFWQHAEVESTNFSLVATIAPCQQQQQQSSEHRPLVFKTVRDGESSTPMPTSKPLSRDGGNEGSMVTNSSSTNSRRIFEGGARSAEEARIPLLDEEEKGGGGGGASETSSRNRRDGAEEDTGAGTRGFAHAGDGGSARRGQKIGHDSAQTYFAVVLNYSSAYYSSVNVQVNYFHPLLFV